MKKTILLAALCTAFVFAACGGGESKPKESVAETVIADAPTDPQTTTAADLKTEADLSKLHTPDTTNDRFAGYWKITEGSGAQLKKFTYEFDGNGRAYVLVGTMGYVGTYEVKQDSGKDVFVSQMIFGDDGYTYEFSKDGKSVVLTSVTDKSTSTMERVEKFSSIPKAEEDFSIDEKLLGAWADDTGEYFYFGKDGVMYNTQRGVSFTFYNYSAKDGKITETYTMTEPATETVSYKFDGDKLIYSGNEYKKISADKLV